jgi:hypothetical protein
VIPQFANDNPRGVLDTHDREVLLAEPEYDRIITELRKRLTISR